MNYTLIGSQTSPFVRRIRLLMENIPFDFKELNIFENEGAKTLHEINPIHQIPVLLLGEKKIWDSRQIFNYINKTHGLFAMNIEDENLLTAIEGAMSAAVTLLLARRSNLPLDGSIMFLKRHQERIESILDFLRPFAEDEALREWNFKTMSLYSFLDWGLFRELISLEKRAQFKKVLTHYQDKPIVIKTAIPKG